MLTPRSLLFAASLVAPLAIASCGKKTPNTEDSQSPITPVPAGGDSKPAVVAEPEPAAERIVVSGSLEGLDDIFASFKKFSDSYMPDQATDPAAEIQAMLLGQGFGPGFWANIDLGGTHTFTSATPVSGGRPEDTSLAASVAVVDARKLIENMPQSQRPEPLGDGMWKLVVDTTNLLMREQGKELLLGFSTADVDSASKLRGKVRAGARLQVRATNIPTDDIDPAAVLDELPADNPLVKKLSEILKELDAVVLDLDIGTTRDFQLRAGAVAPFHKLGLDPIGKPRAASTALEARLPADPVFVTTLSWGDPALLHALVDKVPMDQVPEPVQGMVKKAIASTHALLDQVANDVAIAMYIDKKGQATFVIAADVRDDAKTKAAFQGVHQVLAEGVQTQATMAGSNKDAAFSAKLDLDGLKVGSAKADRLTVKIPKGFKEDTRKARMFLRKDALDVITHVDQGTAIMAIGAGARAVVTDVAKSLGKTRKSSLAQHTGLENLRKSMGGCQICTSGDPLDYLRFRLILVRDDAEDKAVVKKAGEHMYTLSKVGSIGEVGAGIKVEAEAASFGMTIPQSTIYAPRASVEKLTTINDFVDDPEIADSKPAVAKR